MSEVQTELGQEAQGSEAPKGKKAVEVEKVVMSDGSTEEFAGKRTLNKSFSIASDGTVTARFAFRNGEVREAKFASDDGMILQLAGHGALQKIGDETAGVKDASGAPAVEDQVLAVENIITRLTNTGADLKSRWYAERAAGDGFSGASVVIRAVLEATNELRASKGLAAVDVAWVKAFLEKKLEDGKAGGLTRQKLYASFRRPGTKTAAIIERLEKEKKTAGTPAVNADDELEAMAAA